MKGVGAGRRISEKRNRHLAQRHAWCCLAFLMGCQVLVLAQDAPTVTFSLDFPESEPSHYVIVIASDGHASYDSATKHSAESSPGETFHLDFALPPRSSTRVFELAKQARYFSSELDSGKKGMAFTGTKTLTYKDAQKDARATYNYSSIPAVQELTEYFQDLGATMEFGRRLEYHHRYQKLALDQDLKAMEDAASRDTLRELPAIAPVLQKIVNDSSVMNGVRARAQRLLAKAGTG